jgi:hypothetical protein
MSCYCLIVFPSYSLQAVGCGHTDSFMSRWLLDPPSPLLSNQNQLDTNADSIGDACQCESAPQLHVLQVACESVESPVTAAALLSICCGCVWMVLKLWLRLDGADALTSRPYWPAVDVFLLSSPSFPPQPTHTHFGLPAFVCSSVCTAGCSVSPSSDPALCNDGPSGDPALRCTAGWLATPGPIGCTRKRLCHCMRHQYSQGAAPCKCWLGWTVTV